MDYAFSILMGIFSAALLLYAALLAIFKDYKIIPKSQFALEPKNPKRYATQLAKVIALVALSPGLGALVGLWRVPAGLAAMLVSAALFIWLGTRLMRSAE